MTDLRRRTFGPHPTAEDWRAASKAEIERALAAEVVRRNPKLYSGYDEDAVKFVRNTMGTTKWDLLLAAQAFGLAPQGTYLYPDERKRQHAARLGTGPRSSGKQLAQAAKRANDQIYDLVNNKYFQSIPNDQLFSIVKRAGFSFDPEEEEFILVGRDGKATWQLHDASGRPVNHVLVLQWHKMDRTGRYEVVAYVS